MRALADPHGIATAMDGIAVWRAGTEACKNYIRGLKDEL